MVVLSIIVPVYQVEDYLEICLESILKQTFKEYEIILVDDGSTDGSGKICDRYANIYEQVRVIHKKNEGLSSARNVGLEYAKGKYIMFVDSDDVIHPQTAEIELKVLKEKQVDIVLCPICKFSNFKDLRFENIKQENLELISGIEAERRQINGTETATYVSCCGKVYKRDLFNNIRFPKGRLFEDEFTTYKLFFKCKQIGIINVPLYFYYLNPNGITQNLNLEKRFDEYDAQEQKIKFFKEHNCNNLYHISLLNFLRSAQWDLLSYQKNKKYNDHKRGKIFQKQYATMLKSAKQEGIISFTDNYDYYVLAYPKRKLIFRLKRKIFMVIKNN